MRERERERERERDSERERGREMGGERGRGSERERERNERERERENIKTAEPGTNERTHACLQACLRVWQHMLRFYVSFMFPLALSLPTRDAIFLCVAQNPG